MGHGNHWECLGGTAEELVAKYIPLVCAEGDVGEVAKRTAQWFGRKKAAKEAILPMMYRAESLGPMVVCLPRFWF